MEEYSQDHKSPEQGKYRKMSAPPPLIYARKSVPILPNSEPNNAVVTSKVPTPNSDQLTNDLQISVNGEVSKEIKAKVGTILNEALTSNPKKPAPVTPQELKSTIVPQVAQAPVINGQGSVSGKNPKKKAKKSELSILNDALTPKIKKSVPAMKPMSNQEEDSAPSLGPRSQRKRCPPKWMTGDMVLFPQDKLPPMKEPGSGGSPATVAPIKIIREKIPSSAQPKKETTNLQSLRVIITDTSKKSSISTLPNPAVKIREKSINVLPALTPLAKPIANEVKETNKVSPSPKLTLAVKLVRESNNALPSQKPAIQEMKAVKESNPANLKQTSTIKPDSVVQNSVVQKLAPAVKPVKESNNALPSQKPAIQEMKAVKDSNPANLKQTSTIKPDIVVQNSVVQKLAPAVKPVKESNNALPSQKPAIQEMKAVKESNPANLKQTSTIKPDSVVQKLAPAVKPVKETNKLSPPIKVDIQETRSSRRLNGTSNTVNGPKNIDNVKINGSETPSPLEGIPFAGMPKLLNQSGLSVPMITESDDYSSDDEEEKASTSRASQPKQVSLQPYIKGTVINFLSTKISNRNMLRMREELMALKRSGNYFKLTKTAPLAAGLVHDMFLNFTSQN